MTLTKQQKPAVIDEHYIQERLDDVKSLTTFEGRYNKVQRRLDDNTKRERQNDRGYKRFSRVEAEKLKSSYMASLLSIDPSKRTDKIQQGFVFEELANYSGKGSDERSRRACEKSYRKQVATISTSVAKLDYISDKLVFAKEPKKITCCVDMLLGMIQREGLHRKMKTSQWKAYIGKLENLRALLFRNPFPYIVVMHRRHGAKTDGRLSPNLQRGQDHLRERQESCTSLCEEVL